MPTAMTPAQIALLEAIRQCAPERQMQVFDLISDYNKADQKVVAMRRKIEEARDIWSDWSKDIPVGDGLGWLDVIRDAGGK